MTMKINDNGVQRDMTKEEKDKYIKSSEALTEEKEAHEAWAVIALAEAEAQAEAQAAREVARQAVLDRLGLSADEVQLLLGT